MPRFTIKSLMHFTAMACGFMMLVVSLLNRWPWASFFGWAVVSSLLIGAVVYDEFRLKKS